MKEKLKKEVEDFAHEQLCKWQLYAWSFGWNEGTTAFGVCDMDENTITLSKHLITESSNWKDTVLHEIAHALDYVKNRNVGHGDTWKEQCRIVGAIPKRAWEATPKDIDESAFRWKVECSCGVVGYFSKIIKRDRHCKKCKKNLPLTNIETGHTWNSVEAYHAEKGNLPVWPRFN